MKNKDKYILNEIVSKTTDTLSGHKVEIFYKDKIIYERIYLVETSPKKITDFFNWLEQEYKPPILDDVEKAYLSAVIKPFRKDVAYIEKCIFSMDTYYVQISTKTNENINFPNFREKSMYTGMKENRRYTLKELGF